jgi:hypothetical protein
MSFHLKQWHERLNPPKQIQDEPSDEVNLTDHGLEFYLVDRQLNVLD